MNKMQKRTKYHSVFSNRCDGRNSCSTGVTNAWFGSDPCYGIYKYLEVTYKCKRHNYL